MCEEVSRQATLPATGSSSVRAMDAVVSDILPWIEQNLFDERVRVKTITSKSGYGHSHFQRAFRDRTGYNLGEYIRLRRVMRAAVAVIATNKGLLDIAVENGFTSQQNFTRTFRKYLTLTPGAFRNQYGHDLHACERFLSERLSPDTAPWLRLALASHQYGSPLFCAA